MEHVQVINAHLNLEGHRIGAVGDPTSDQEVATKAYVDRAIKAALAVLAEVKEAEKAPSKKP